MKIFVLVKEVPDTYGDRKLNLETGLADRAAGDVVLDEITERALEVALRYADKNDGTEVVALSMAPAGSTASVRRALAIGASSAVHVADEELVGADLGLTAEVLAAA
ncbi:MAG: electron transfer flavoprotein subunit beta, partial [Rhodoglobus sp.]|nr:electron transfer flavoprotein subunit beta [Rhodoglobus sp.]